MTTERINVRFIYLGPSGSDRLQRFVYLRLSKIRAFSLIHVKKQKMAITSSAELLTCLVPIIDVAILSRNRKSRIVVNYVNFRAVLLQSVLQLVPDLL